MLFREVSQKSLTFLKKLLLFLVHFIFFPEYVMFSFCIVIFLASVKINSSFSPDVSNSDSKITLLMMPMDHDLPVHSP